MSSEEINLESLREIGWDCGSCSGHWKIKSGFFNYSAKAPGGVEDYHPSYCLVWRQEDKPHGFTTGLTLVKFIDGAVSQEVEMHAMTLIDVIRAMKLFGAKFGD